jgi:Fic family protein
MTPYVPDELPLQSLDWTKFISLIGSANAELARYDATLQAIVNPQVLLSPLATQEAVLSSKIEGTRTSLEEVLQYDASQEVARSSARENCAKSRTGSAHPEAP